MNFFSKKIAVLLISVDKKIIKEWNRGRSLPPVIGNVISAANDYALFYRGHAIKPGTLFFQSSPAGVTLAVMPKRPLTLHFIEHSYM